MNKILHSVIAESITLTQAIEDYQKLLSLSPAIALLYSPQTCQLAILNKNSELINSQEEKIASEYKINHIFEARIFNENYELRWLNTDQGYGKAAIVSEENFDNLWKKDTITSEENFPNLWKQNNSEEFLETVDTSYLLWGKKTTTQLENQWQRLTIARIGYVDIPLKTQSSRVYLKTKEYLKKVDYFGNVAVFEERLIKLEEKIK